jgi:hypothetical protein
MAILIFKKFLLIKKRIFEKILLFRKEIFEILFFVKIICQMVKIHHKTLLVMTCGIS